MYKTRICPVCNSEFVPESSTQKYCSANCYRIVKNNKRNKFSREELNRNEIKKCLVCGESFETNNRTMTKKYCSDDCRRKAERIFGSKNQTDLEYHNQRKFSGKKYDILKRDEYKCQMCGSERQLIIHHLDETGNLDNPNNADDNLITLCRSCHAKLHGLNNRVKRGIIGSTGL